MTVEVQLKQSIFGRLLMATHIPKILLRLGVMDIDALILFVAGTYRYRVSGAKTWIKIRP